MNSKLPKRPRKQLRWIVFKIIAFFGVFLFAQGVMLPWAIYNSTMPLWADIILVTIILMMWLAAIDRLAYHLLRVIRKNDEATE